MQYNKSELGLENADIHVFDRGSYELSKSINIYNNATLLIGIHVDDIEYSVFSELCNEEVIILIPADSNNQRLRLQAYKEISKLLNNKITVIHTKTFIDGNSDQVPIKNMIQVLDKLVIYFNKIYFPSSSNHQDHQYVNKACHAAFRYRNDFSYPKEIYEYFYIYNYSESSINVYNAISDEDMKHKYECLKLMNNYDEGILKDRVNCKQVIESLARVEGIKIGATYAEGFKLYRLCK